MTHPTDVEAAWQALADATHTDRLTPELSNLATVLENAGLKVSVIDGALYADDVNVDPATGIADCAASFRIIQEA